MPKLKKIGHLFPSLRSRVAYYDHATFVVYLETISENDYDRTLKTPFHPKSIENLKTILHELRHYIDHISTLWGQRQILNYLKALDTRLSNDTSNFDLIINYKNYENQIFYSDYYSEEYNYIPIDKMDKRWRWHATSGLRFDSNGSPDENRPIPMIHFVTHDKTPLIRVPLSIASLLETNAVSEEVRIHMGYIQTFVENERPFQLKMYEQDTLKNLIYNQDLAIYNVAVHLTANILGLTDIVEAFKISSTISTLSLNLPISLTESIPINEDYFGKWGKRSEKMLLNQEYGFIFFSLLVNYAPTYSRSKKFNLNEVLEASGLPQYDDLYALILKDSDNIIEELKSIDNFEDIFLTQLKSGRTQLEILGIGFENKSIFEACFENGIKPTIICTDTNIDVEKIRASDIYKMQPIKGLSFSEWYNIAWTLNDKLSELYKVRGL